MVKVKKYIIYSVIRLDIANIIPKLVLRPAAHSTFLFISGDYTLLVVTALYKSTYLEN